MLATLERKDTLMVALHLANGEWHRGCQMLSGFYGISDKLRKVFCFKGHFLCVFLSFLPRNSWFCSGASWGGGGLCDFLAIANFNGTGFSGEHSVLARPASLCCRDFLTTLHFYGTFWQILIVHLCWKIAPQGTSSRETASLMAHRWCLTSEPTTYRESFAQMWRRFPGNLNSELCSAFYKAYIYCTTILLLRPSGM